MKIGIDINDLHRRTTGIGRYILSLINELIKIDSTSRYSLLSKEVVSNKFESTNIELVNKPSKSETFWGQYWLPRMAKQSGVDVLHCPSVRAPLFSKVPLIITVHDVIFKKYPQFFTSFDRNYMDILYSLTLKRCDHIIAVSKCTKNDIIECYGIAEKKIEVIYNGVEEGFRQVEKQEALNIVAKANLVLPEKFVLFIGTLEPRKNVLTLIKAFDRIKEKGIVEELVIIGKKGWLFEETLEYLRCSKFNSQIHYLGHVEDYALPSIYSLAEIFVYPSLYEGFGYPILEAMACGTPVITNSTPALLEVLDGAGSVVDATSVDILAEAIVHLIDNKTLQKQFQDRGLTRARELSVRKKAEATLGMYKRISN